MAKFTKLPIVFAKFDGIPSLPVQDTKEKPKCCGQRIAKGNNSNRIGPYPLFFYYKCSSCGGERGGSVVECRTPEREVRGSRPTAAVLCP